MAAKSFTKGEWDRIRRVLEAEPDRYGLPDQVYGSVLLASFNIRKLGAVSRRSKETWKFLADVCWRFDLLAVQEVLDDLSGLRRLQELMGPGFGMIVSDKTGAFPNEPGGGERLGFIFNRSVLRRTEIATDVSYDRTAVLNTIGRHNDEIHEAMAPFARKLNDYLTKMERYKAGTLVKKPRKPPFKVKMPVFLTFIRTPFCVSFEISGHPGTSPYQFMAINAHLYYGNYMADRRQEFDALMAWIMSRVREHDRAYYPNFILMGDLNLDFNNPKTDRKRIERHMKTFNDEFDDDVQVNFPFLDPYPGKKEVFRTNACLDETFDQIGLFSRDMRFPSHSDNARAGQDPRGPDYGVFDSVNLFSEALNDQPLDALPRETRAALLARFEHKVSDHLPLWLRLPLP